MDKEFTERRSVWRRIGSAEEMQESMIEFHEVSISDSVVEAIESVRSQRGRVCGSCPN